MTLRIIALTIVVCLSLSTLSLASQRSLLPEDTSQLSNPGLSITEQRRSIRTHIFLGVAVGLAGAGLAIINESARRPDESTTGWAIGIAVIGFGYAFYNWMRLQALG